MSPIAIIEEALSEGRALSAAAEELRDMFKSARDEVDALRAEAKGLVEGALSKLRAGLDGFRAQASEIEGAGAGAEPPPVAAPSPASSTPGGPAG